MQRARVSNHPCHRLSVPAAKRFWCRHCMMVFEDAITRWRHSRSCRSGGFDNFVRRREIETQALQKMAETLDPEMVTQVPVHSSESGAGSSKELCCFICRQRFVSLDEMREHVKYPCNKPVSLQRPSMTVYIEEPTFGTGIQQHYTEGPASSQAHAMGEQGSSTAPAASSADNPHPVSVYMNESEQGHQDNEAKPTNIYVNEKGETVIEVENLDLNTKSGELSLAHLLTQLSQQGIVFDHQPQGETEVSTSQQVVHETPAPETDYSQPTAVDAANTLTQLAGSVYRAASNPQETYAYPPPMKRIKTEGGEFQYNTLEQPPEHMQVQTYIQKSEPVDETGQEKYIICTNESEVISVVRADNTSPENSNSGIMYQNGTVSVQGEAEASSIQAASGEAIVFEGQPNHGSQTVTVHAPENGAGHNFAGAPMMVLQQDQVQIHTQPTQQLVKTEDASGQQLVITTHNPMEFDQSGQTAVVSHYPSEESALAVIQSEVINQGHSDNKVSLIVETSASEAGSALTAGSVNAVTADLLRDSEEQATRAALAEYVAGPVGETAQAECVTEPVSQITSVDYVAEPVSLTSQAECVTGPVRQIVNVDYVAEPVSETNRAECVAEPVSQMADVDFVAEPVSQMAQADCVSDPVNQTAHIDYVTEPISQTSEADGSTDPVGRTSQVDCVAEPITQTAQVDCFPEPAGHVDSVTDSVSQPAQAECVEEPISQTAHSDLVAESGEQLPQIVTVVSSTLQDPQLVVQQPEPHGQGSSEENCLISDGRTHNKKCKKMLHATKQTSVESQKWLHERIVTRSVSVNLQSQKTKVLRSRSLPTLDNGISKRRKLAKSSCLLTENVKPSLGLSNGDLLIIKATKKPSVSHFLPAELSMKKTLLVGSENSGAKQKHIMTDNESKQENKRIGPQVDGSSKQKHVMVVDNENKQENKQIDSPCNSNGNLTGTDKQNSCFLLQKKETLDSKPRVFKCIVCNVIFNSAQLLRKHRQVPCRVKHTRTMSQKVLRPRPAIMCKTSVKDNPLKIQTKRSVLPDFKLVKDSSKPRLLMASLLLHSKSSLSRDKVSNKKRLFLPLPVRPPSLRPKEQSICLPGKQLLFSSLYGKELHMAKLGLVSTKHMTSSALLRHQVLLCRKVAIARRWQQEASNVHFPQSPTILSHCDDTINMMSIAGNARFDSGGRYPPPPVLEPVDLSTDFDLFAPLYSQPPHLEPMVFLPCAETTVFDCCNSVCSQPPHLDPVFLLGPCVDTDLDSPCRVKCSQLFSNKTNGLDNNGQGDYRTVPVAQKPSSPSSFRPFARITIKSLQSGLRLCEGGEIIIKTLCNKDRVLLINPD